MKISRIFIPCLLALGLLALQSPSPVAAEAQTETHCLENNRVCVEIQFDVTCNGWNWSLTSYSYGETGITVTSSQWIPWGDQWTDPYSLETDMLTYRFSVLDFGSGLTDGPYEFAYLITEPGVCLLASPSTCDLEPMYYMYTLRDTNQPEIWQTYCYIISDEGFPGIERQAQICSVAGFDHTYQATHGVYSGWVSKDCMGQPHYGWSAWDPDWYRADFATH